MPGSKKTAVKGKANKKGIAHGDESPSQIYPDCSPKVQVIVPAIKGKKVEEAIALLQFMPRKGARILKRVLHSAVANAGQNKVDIDTLVVKKIMVDGGPTLKRFMPRAMGRATPILKRTSHITVFLDEILRTRRIAWDKKHIR